MRRVFASRIITPSTSAAAAESRAGLIYGIVAYGLWGAMPLFFRQMAGVSPVEILAHRALWSFVFVALIVMAMGKLRVARALLGDRKTLLLLVASTCFIAANWLTYIYAVSTHQVVQAGLGYFITPLANVLLGVVVLGERLRRLPLLALFVAAAGVVILSIHAGQAPWIALLLAVTFSTYGLLRKLAATEALVGLWIETTLLAPLAIGYLCYLESQGAGVFAFDANAQNGWLAATGPVTTAPLVCFAAAARRLPMTALGFLQFITPTLQMGVAIFLFREPFTTAHAWAFALIWTAVALYLFDILRRRGG
ncbi:MAG: EamA family transporter RarD [Planctomycetaceae bacterium]|nr:EamA family transporter RarD [Planctomycetaceae bacterium]